MRPLIILRPEPGASATAAAATALGLAATKTPLFEIIALPWAAPDPALFDAIMITSANALRAGGNAVARYRHLPLYAVGAATARAARDAGFGDVRSSAGDAAALTARIVADGCLQVLHLAGRERTALPTVPFTVTTAIVYASAAIIDPVVPQSGVAMVHSVRAAARFADLIAVRSAIAIIAISAPVAAAAGPGWAVIAVAATPDDAAMLALAPGLCKA
jgi:uroporphyrinogen-III synthase